MTPGSPEHGGAPAPPAGPPTFEERYERGLGFTLDRFQRRAMDALRAGQSVLVSAPTGSGKTMVADFAAALALEKGGKTFYTTPLKALSNQKYQELAARFGATRVGLLTGDVSHQSEAPIVVMTTEVLRNMLFSRSTTLTNLATVVLDEVHYLQDPYRGSVWEEVLVLTPGRVSFVCLSATVTNAVDFGRWLASVRGPTCVVVEERRPVDIDLHVAVAERGRDGVSLVPLLVGARPHPRVVALDERRLRGSRHRLRAPRRSELVEYLGQAAMLPAITFIFSRTGCEDAARQCLSDGLVLTTAEERVRIRSIAEDAVDRLGDDDLRTLGYGTFSAALEAGVAAHHAGLVPAFRHAVERCFGAGLIKMVFATETLALGINMPARTVVIERFAKFRGAERSALTSGEFRQLTGRAGRRGIDSLGHAVVLWTPSTSLRMVAATATSPPPDLRSSFHPTYNLTVNLVRRWTREDAHALLAASYGQWQASEGSESLPVLLDRRLAVLGQRGYVSGWRLTGAGKVLAGIYHECDLLIAEALGTGVFDGLRPDELAAVASGLTFEARRPEADPPAPRSEVVADRLAQLACLAGGLRSDERRHGLRRTRRPEAGLARAVTSWARGRSLSTVLKECDIAPGDLVRNIRQLLDLLCQLTQVASKPSTAEAAGHAVALLRRGVVAVDDEMAPVGSATWDLPPS